MSIMADVATVFHWPPSELYEMDIPEIWKWRELAAARMPKKAK